MPSFDIVSEIDLQEIDNAVNMAMKEIQTRYDFKGSKSSIELDKGNNLILINADDDYKMGACWDILGSKIVKRGISLKALDAGKIEDATGASKRRKINLVMGIEKEKAKDIVKFVKNSKVKVQPQIQDNKVRVTGKKRDDLQEVINQLKAQDFGIPLQFDNFRD